MRVCICGTVKNCGAYLENVLQNMYRIGSLFESFVIFLYYDDSQDETWTILEAHKATHPNLFVHRNTTFRSPFRTHRIAHGRNTCLDFIRANYPTHEYFIMMDCDNPCSETVHTDVLAKYLGRADWDALTFRKEPYYDIWALSLSPYNVSFVHFPNYVHVLNTMTNYVEKRLNELKEGELLECNSAFNGFAIYRTALFLKGRYDGSLRMDLIPKRLQRETFAANGSPIMFIPCGWLDIREEDCEHRSFHMAAVARGCRIRIAPDILFEGAVRY